MYLQGNVPFEMFELERSEIETKSSQHELNTLIHQVQWILLALVVVYQEMINKFVMVVEGKETNSYLSPVPPKDYGVQPGRSLSCLFVCLCICLPVYLSAWNTKM